MRRLVLAATVAIAGSAFGVSAQAMPGLQVAPQADGAIVQVMGGCGQGGHRNPYGRCVPNFRRPFFRACPPGMHPVGYGRCRPNF